MKRITKISSLARYRLNVEFEDGVIGTVDLEHDLFGPVFEPLRDESLFSQVRLDEFGVPCWPNGADLAPDAIYAELTGQPITRPGSQRKGSQQQKPL